MRVRCRDFNFFALGFSNEVEGKNVFESVQRLTCVGTSLVVWKGGVDGQLRQISCMPSFTILARLRRRLIRGGYISPLRNLKGWDWEQRQMNGD